MKNIFSAIFKSHVKNVPNTVVKCLTNHFPEAINVEWEAKENIFEAVFYLNEIEHIAYINEKGKLIEYKKNLWINELPISINAEAEKIGEIMNAIVIYRTPEQFYEIIVRNKEFNRTLMLFNSNGILQTMNEI